jgi:hypothetical protein
MNATEPIDIAGATVAVNVTAWPNTGACGVTLANVVLVEVAPSPTGITSPNAIRCRHCQSLHRHSRDVIAINLYSAYRPVTQYGQLLSRFSQELPGLYARTPIGFLQEFTKLQFPCADARVIIQPSGFSLLAPLASDQATRLRSTPAVWGKRLVSILGEKQS